MTDTPAAPPIAAEFTVERLQRIAAWKPNWKGRLSLNAQLARALIAANERIKDQGALLETLTEKLAAITRERDQWQAEAQQQSEFAGECNRERLEEKKLRWEAEQRCKALAEMLQNAIVTLNALGCSEDELAIYRDALLSNPTPPADVIAKVEKTGGGKGES